PRATDGKATHGPDLVRGRRHEPLPRDPEREARLGAQPAQDPGRRARGGRAPRTRPGARRHRSGARGAHPRPPRAQVLDGLDRVVVPDGPGRDLPGRRSGGHMSDVHVRSLDHASVRIADLARSRAFYEGLLGLRMAPRPDLGFPGAWYDLGGAQLHLIEQRKMFEDIDRPIRTSRSGWRASSWCDRPSTRAVSPTSTSAAPSSGSAIPTATWSSSASRADGSGPPRVLAGGREWGACGRTSPRSPPPVSAPTSPAPR